MWLGVARLAKKKEKGNKENRAQGNALYAVRGLRLNRDRNADTESIYRYGPSLGTNYRAFRQVKKTEVSRLRSCSQDDLKGDEKKACTPLNHLGCDITQTKCVPNTEKESPTCCNLILTIRPQFCWFAALVAWVLLKCRAFLLRSSFLLRSNQINCRIVSAGTLAATRL